MDQETDRIFVFVKKQREILVRIERKAKKETDNASQIKADPEADPESEKTKEARQ